MTRPGGWIAVTGLVGAGWFAAAAAASAQMPPPLANVAVNGTAIAPANAPATRPLPGYLLVVGKTTDRVKIRGYAASLPPIYASHDAY